MVTERFPVRAFASGAVHLADVPPELLTPAAHCGSPFTAVPLPAVMLCGATLHPRYGYTVAVRMLPDARVTCRPCRRSGAP